MIFATAIYTCDYIVTMDVSFFDQINETPSLINAIRKINENFRFWFNDLSEDLKALKLIDS